MSNEFPSHSLEKPEEEKKEELGLVDRVIQKLGEDENGSDIILKYLQKMHEEKTFPKKRMPKIMMRKILLLYIADNYIGDDKGKKDELVEIVEGILENTDIEIGGKLWKKYIAAFGECRGGLPKEEAPSPRKPQQVAMKKTPPEDKPKKKKKKRERKKGFKRDVPRDVIDGKSRGAGERYNNNDY